MLAPGSERSGLAGTLGSAVQAAHRHYPASTAEGQHDVTWVPGGITTGARLFVCVREDADRIQGPLLGEAIAMTHPLGDTADEAERWWRAYQLAENDQAGQLRECAHAGDDVMPDGF